jgi:hypothetical protein
MRNIAILIFDDAEVLDFCGPFEVFSVTNELNNYELFNVYTAGRFPGSNPQPPGRNCSLRCVRAHWCSPRRVCSTV